jgi:hypothetical protein
MSLPVNASCGHQASHATGWKNLWAVGHCVVHRTNRPVISELAILRQLCAKQM